MTAAAQADALATLELPAVLDVVAGYAAGPLGADQLRGRTPTIDLHWIRRELDLVRELLTALDRGETFDIPPVPPIKGALGRLKLEGSVLELGELAAVRDTLVAGRKIAAELARIAERSPTLASIRAEPVSNIIERQLERSIGDDGELLDSASPALAAARREVHSARERLIRKLDGVLRDLDSGAGGSVTMRSGRYVIPVRRDARSRPQGIVHDESGSAGTLFIEPTAAIELGNALREAIIGEERAVLIVLRELTNLLRPFRDAIGHLHEMAVESDTILARTRWARDTRASVPEVVECGGPLYLCGARHPLLLARGVAVVPFDLVLDGIERTLLISGPNTGGKTVLLKAAALMIALMQCGVVPPVDAGSRLPVVRRFFVDIGDHQSLQADLSTFSAHVAELRQILDGADAGAMVILDEVGSGTDPAEGGALAMAVLETLTRRGTLTLATTHLGALKSLATRVPGVVNGSLQFDAATLSPTYRFTKGIPGRSYGLAIARKLGVDAAVLEQAEALVPDAERQLDRLLAAVEMREQTLNRAQSLADARDQDLERREAVATATETAQQARATELRQREKDAERDRARQAKAYLLEARKKVEDALSMARGAADEVTAREARRLLEEGIREESTRLEESEPIVALSADAIAVGDRVRLGTGATGQLAEIRNDGRAVVLVGAMRLVVKTGTLTKVSGGAGARPQREIQSPDETVRDAVYEVDLRGMRVDEGEGMLLGFLDAAVLAEQPHLRIIHGMGTGAMRDAVRRLLQHDPRVASFDFAPRQQGGTGVTIAVLR
jgi:DNA mismatch repair protein MutS2